VNPAQFGVGGLELEAGAGSGGFGNAGSGGLEGGSLFVDIISGVVGGSGALSVLPWLVSICVALACDVFDL
jgi:hypothetical protein